MTVLALVPARAGSDRLAGKNRLEIGGIQLWQRAVLAAVEATGIDEVLVSTDDEEILASDWAPETRRQYAVAERPAFLLEQRREPPGRTDGNADKLCA